MDKTKALQLIKEKALERLQANTPEWSNWYAILLVCETALHGPQEIDQDDINWAMNKIDELDAENT